MLPDERDVDSAPATGNVAGFSLHAGIAAKADERDKVRSRSDREGALGYKLERLCRYITRPAIAQKRLSLTISEVHSFLADLHKTDANDSTRFAFEFLILTATRTIEVIRGEWSEIDIKRNSWTIPAERMKAGRQDRSRTSDATNSHRRSRHAAPCCFPAVT